MRYTRPGYSKTLPGLVSQAATRLVEEYLVYLREAKHICCGTTMQTHYDPIYGKHRYWLCEECQTTVPEL